MRLRMIEQSGRTAARAGFTLMELLVVMAIMLVLAGVAIPSYYYYKKTADVKTARTACVMYAGELKHYMADNSGPPIELGQWPPTINSGIPPVDPWNNPYQWSMIEDPVLGTMIPVVISAGPDGQPGTIDDITSMPAQLQQPMAP